MAITILAPTSESVIRYAWPVMVQTKQSWSDDWRWQPEMLMTQARWSSGGHDLSDATFKRFFGESVKMPWESALNTKLPWNGGYNVWVRVGMMGNGGYTPVWIGRLSGEGRNVMGGLYGDQMWQAYGPMQILRKIHVSTSWWSVDGFLDELGWATSFNDRWTEDEEGNRSASKSGDTYVFGGTDAWTNHDILEYLILRYVDESEDDGPEWGLAGSQDVLDALKEMTGPLKMDATQTVADLLAKLIPVEAGLDYTIFATSSGFVIWVYALTPYNWHFAGKTMPRNKDRVRIAAAQSVDSDGTRIAWDGSRTYGRLRVLGNRLVCCCTLRGAAVVDAEGNAHPLAGSLEPKWTSTLEDDYKTGGGAFTDANGFDLIRKQDKYRGVYQQFGAPSDWDYYGGEAMPEFDAVTGEPQTTIVGWQNAIRKTLVWLPMRENVDYSTDPETDNNPNDHKPELLKPQVWIAGVNPDDPFTSTAQAWTPLDQEGWGVSVAKQGLGVMLKASDLNHALGKNHFDTDPASEPSNVQVYYDYERLAVTLAFQTDYRMAMEVKAPGWVPSDGTLDVVVDDAEFWYLAPQTCVGVDATGQIQETGGTARVLRNDLPKLQQQMASILSRYYGGRTRAEVSFKGLLPWPLLVGRILTVLQTAGDTYNLAAPITSISWTNPGGRDQPPTTTIHAGFAR